MSRFERCNLMIAGPTEIESEVRMAAAEPMVYNRTPDYSKFVEQLGGKLKKIFKTSNEVYILSASGTGAMEAAVTNVVSPGDEIVVLSGGTFGHRWYEIASRYGANCTMVEVEQGHSVDPQVIADAISERTKVVFVTANETSTGVLIDLKAIADVVRSTDAILVVDAVSSLCADPLETDAWGLDVVITSTQKALALPPGMSFITLSDKAWKCVEASTLPKYYFDLKFYRDNMRRGQTPFTPPISLMYQLDERLDRFLAVGVDESLSAQREKSLHLRNGVKSLGLEIIGEHPSNGVLGIKFSPDIDAFKVVTALREKYNIEITPSPGDDKSRIARIGLLGDISMKDIDALIQALEDLL